MLWIRYVGRTKYPCSFKDIWLKKYAQVDSNIWDMYCSWEASFDFFNWLSISVERDDWFEFGEGFNDELSNWEFNNRLSIRVPCRYEYEEMIRFIWPKWLINLLWPEYSKLFLWADTYDNSNNALAVSFELSVSWDYIFNNINRWLWLHVALFEFKDVDDMDDRKSLVRKYLDTMGHCF